MVPAGMPELRESCDIEYLQDMMLFSPSDEETSSLTPHKSKVNLHPTTAGVRPAHNVDSDAPLSNGAIPDQVKGYEAGMGPSNRSSLVSGYFISVP